MDIQKKTDGIQFWVLNVASFLGQLSIAMVNLAVVYYLRSRFTLSAQMIGIATSVYTFTYFLFCIIGGGVCGRMRPRHCIELSMVGMSISIALLIFCGKLWQVFLALALYGSFMSMLWPQVEGWFSRGKEGAQLNRVTSSFNFSWSFGAGISPYVAGVLVERSATLPLAAGIGIFAMVFLLIFLASAIVPGIRAVGSEHAHVGEIHSEDHSTPLRYLCWAGIVMVYTGLSVVQTVFPLFAQDVMRISESTAGFLLLVRGISTCCMFMFLGKTCWWQFRLPVILCVQLLFGLVCLLGMAIPGTTSVSAFVAYGMFFFVFGILFAIAYTLSMFHGASGCINRSRRMMIHEVLLTVGTIVGAIFGGTIYEHFSFQQVLFAIFLFVVTLIAVEAVGVIVLETRRRMWRHV